MKVKIKLIDAIQAFVWSRIRTHTRARAYTHTHGQIEKRALVVFKATFPPPFQMPIRVLFLSLSLSLSSSGEPASQVPSLALSVLLSLPGGMPKVEVIRFQSASTAALGVLTTSYVLSASRQVGEYR